MPPKKMPFRQQSATSTERLATTHVVMLSSLALHAARASCTPALFTRLGLFWWQIYGKLPFVQPRDARLFRQSYMKKKRHGPARGWQVSGGITTMAKDTPRPIVVKTTVQLPKETLDAARATAARRNASISDVVRGALDLHTVITDARNAGQKILIEAPDKTVREIIILH